MTKKLFVTDLDGTLVADEDIIHSTSLDLMKKWKEKGNFLTLCTGRTLEEAIQLAELMEVNAPIIVNSGSLLVQADSREILSEETVPKSALNLIKEVMDKDPELAILVASDLGPLSLRKNDHLMEKGTYHDRNSAMARLDELIDRKLYKIQLVHPDHGRLEKYRSLFEKAKEPMIFKFASRTFVEIVSSASGKDKGLAKLLDHLNIAPKNTGYAGDGHTDIPAMKLVGHSFAPEDAMEAVRDASQQLIPSPKRLGINDALLYMLDLK